MGYHQSANHLTIFEDHQCSNGLYAEVRSQAAILLACINIHLRQGQSSLVLIAQTP
jgi:hypothetical protein